MADKLTLDRHAMKDRATAHLRIYVGGLTENATMDELYEHFIQFGQINGIVINRNFGFVQFESESSAQDAINKANGSVFQGKSLNVRTAQSNPDKRYERCAAPPPPAVDVAPPPVLSETPLQKHDDNSAESDAKPNGSDEPEKPPRLRKRVRGRRRRKAKTVSESESALISNKRETEVVTMQLEVPPAVVLTDNTPIVIDDNDEPYDNYGNFIGDQNKKNFRGGDEDYEDGYNQSWNEGRGRGRGRGAPRGRGMRGRGAGGNFRERSPAGGRGGEWVDRGGYDRYAQPDYPRALPVPERNDCEIIVVSKTLTEYAEYIEGRLKRLGIVVDLLFPMEDVPIGKVLGNIASRGCLYAILVMPQNQENRSLTLTILHGLPQEHRNMPIEDALQLLSRNFQEVQRGGPSGREAVYALLGQLADGRTLTVLQYDKVIEYLQERREIQVKIELGEPLTTPTSKTQVDLQERIMSILNDKKVAAPSEPPPAAPPAAAAAGQSKLLNDPTVRKALDTILMKFT